MKSFLKLVTMTSIISIIYGSRALLGNDTVLQIGYITGAIQLPNENFTRPDPLLSAALTAAVDYINNVNILPFGYKLNSRYVESFGNPNISVQEIVRLAEEQNVAVIIGPPDMCYTESAIADAFNIPMFSYDCNDHRVSKKKRSTFIRTKPQEIEAGDAVTALLLEFSWNKVTLVVSTRQELARLGEFIELSLQQNNITIQYMESFESQNIHTLFGSPFQDIVQRTHKKTRIYVVVGTFLEPFGLAVHLDQRGLLGSGEYFVVGVDNEIFNPSQAARYLEEFYKIKNSSHSNTLPKLDVRHKMLNSSRAYMHISLMGFKSSKRLLELQSVIRRYLEQPYLVHLAQVENRTVSQQMILPPEAGYLYDAVMLYAKAAAYLLKEGKDPSDGHEVLQFLKGQQYDSVLGFENRISLDGDCEGNYTVLQIVASGMSLRPIGMYEMSEKPKNLPTFKILRGVKVNWLYDRPPLDEPVCGFQGELCIVKKDYVKEIVLGVFGVLLICICVVCIFSIRSRKFERELEQLLWKIDFRSIKITEVKIASLNTTTQAIKSSNCKTDVSGENGRINKFTDSQMDLDDVEEETAMQLINKQSEMNQSTSEIDRSHLYTRVGDIKGQFVAIKAVRKPNIHLNRLVKKELKTLRDINHPNLTKFVGACIDPPEICVVWEYCLRGSLQDILYNEELSLESIFITSLIFDIINGMVFLHDSDIRFHGCLRSSNCVVDSRWALKLTDFGLQAFKSGEVVKEVNEIEFFSNLQWSAPEILRYDALNKPHVHMHNLLVNGNCAISSDTAVNYTNDYPARQRADVYSFAIILYEMHLRKMPFSYTDHTPREIIKRILVISQEFRIPYRPKLSQLSAVSKIITDCIMICWSENSFQRPTFKQIRQLLKPLQAGIKSNIFDHIMCLMEQYAKNLENLISDRTEKLSEEKKKTEDLLYQMLPLRVAEQLKRGEPVEAESFDSVSIYFSDICGFTDLCSVSTPIEVVEMLSDLYNKFDGIISEYNVYKVETIGDAYMVTSGLPVRNDYHAAEIASMSLHLLDVIRYMRIRSRPREVMRLRIGIHSGPCCAGVVGTRMPRYCLFGDTVNYASRMESTGEPGRIHCSKPCKEQLDKLGGFVCKERGTIEVKGKGSLTTYWLLSKTEEIT